MFHELKVSYFGTDAEILAQADVISHITENFPPVYITDGNHGTFDAQAKKLHQRLNELQVLNVFNYYSLEEVQLEHGYDSNFSSPYARDNLNQELQFLHNLLTG